jgi:uncharacterized protein (TIGR00369 family)
MPEEVPPPPEGYRLSARGPYTTHNGPMFHRDSADGRVEHAFYVLARHCNGMGAVHGGMLTTFLDGLLARAVFDQVKAPSVTLHLSVDFLSAVRAGEWVFGEAAVTRAARDITFAEARIHAAGRDVARGSGVFRQAYQNRS